MSFTQVTNFKTTLTTGLASGGSETTISLNSVTTTDSHTLVTADIGDLAFVVINPGGSTMEICSFTGFSGTTLTGVTRGLAFYGTSVAAVTANKKAHSSGETVIISNNHHWLTEQVVNVDDTQTIAGLKTFTLIPKTLGGNPTDNTELARKAYVDLIGTGTATMNKVVIAGTAGETITTGQLVYLKVSDGRWWLTDADTAATVENVTLGIAQGAGSAAGAITSGVLTYGLDTNQTGLTANTKYYASNTAGGLSTSAGTKEVSIGVTPSTTSIFFDPRYDQKLTENQQDAVESLEAGTLFYAASAVGTDAYAITIAPPITAYVNGMKFRFKADVGNTGAATLAVSGLSAIDLKKLHDQALATGDIEANQIVEVVYNSTGPVFEMTSQTAVVEPTVDVQTFTSSGTWTKPTGALSVEVYAMGGGGGGGAGITGDNGSERDGGGGGGGGGLAFKRFLAAGLGSTETVTIGAAGTGGATSGANGVAGGDTTFGTSALLIAKGGSLGVGGTGGGTGGAASSTANGEIIVAGGAGGDGAAGTGAAGTDTASVSSPRGGGGGGAIGTGDQQNAGGAGGAFITNYVKAGGAGGSAGGAGSIGLSSINLLFGGTGGGGSSGVNGAGTTAGAGINGSGGGGGGGCRSGVGAGGAGSLGAVVVITYI